MTRLAITAIIAIMCGCSAGAHSWYDRECCDTTDCAPIVIQDVPRIIDIGPAGITVRIAKGDHPLFADAWGERFFPWDSSGIRQSQDDDWHVCISEHPSFTEYGSTAPHRIYCVYMPPFGF